MGRRITLTLPGFVLASSAVGCGDTTDGLTSRSISSAAAAPLDVENAAPAPSDTGQVR